MDVPIIENPPTNNNNNTNTKVSQKLKNLHFNALKNKTIEEEDDDDVDDQPIQSQHDDNTPIIIVDNGKQASTSNLNRKITPHTSCDSGVSVNSYNAHETTKYKKLDNSEQSKKSDETGSNASSGRSSVVRVPVGGVELPGMVSGGSNRHSPPFKSFINNSMRSIKSIDDPGSRFSPPSCPGSFVRTASFIYSDSASQISGRPFSDAASIRSLASIGIGSTDGKRMVIRKVPTSPSELMNIINPPT